ncbi:DUF4825 domain-containing protein [Sporosarcina sp. BI001-red]|uniref:DUF4825 domain-containing protein n=1 Tax=Sporosarcina sp. BI001-red TaxID=2282866 RepID=UPI000E232545|nr:DUF4825 domain-containing protein [Sporosarcina sp. BI001-red]REB06082.1 DUF4825 domain-containing protein [Sporosarcina sp. BI001-red]
MRKGLYAVILAGGLVLSGCSVGEKADPDLFQYKDSYVGDANKLGAIAKELPGYSQYEGMELKTKKEPYEVKLYYETADGEFTDEMMMRNATAYFVLVQNTDLVTIVVDGKGHTAKRKGMEEWYGVDLRDVNNEVELKKLEDDKPVDSDEIAVIFEEK